MRIRTKGKGIIRRALLLYLCAVLAMGCACAEETESVILGGDGKSLLTYGTTLADGRILMVGHHEDFGQDAGSGWLLCLNPDRTVSWEYTDDNHDSDFYFSAAELEEGTIGVVARHSATDEKAGFQHTLRFFTTDGKPTGKEVSIPCRKDGVFILKATKSRLQMLDVNVIAKAGENQNRSEYYEGYLIDWDGNETAFLGDIELGDANGDMIEEDDGLVMNGYVFYDFKMSKAVRKTDLQGNLIWETRLECAWPDTIQADAERIIPAGDGGYIVLQTESIQTDGDTEQGYRCALVKLDHEGNILWTRKDGLEGSTDWGWLLAAADGEIALSFLNTEYGEASYRTDNPRRIAWFDENGKFLGNVEMKFSPENYPELEKSIGALTNRKDKIPMFFEDQLIFLKDGLWVSGQFIVYGISEDQLIGEGAGAGLFKVPEL